ncbi:MAG: PspC domain-containing protein [Actinobacteria bacterium]|nr:MAG: PspC domain-containing protein [Actinomycetota bacterium]
MSSSELPPERPRARLIRTRRGRLIGGVCSGLGAHFGVDPILLRIAFVALAIFGGIGFWLYLAFLLLVPEEGASAPPLRLRQLPWRLIAGAAALIAAAAVGLPAASHPALGSAWPAGVVVGTIALVGVAALGLRIALRRRIREQRRSDPERAPSPDQRLWSFLALAVAVTAGIVLLALAGAWLAGTERHVAAWAVVALGAALALAAFTGARRLVVPALAFALPVAAIAAAHADLHGGVGERTYRPAALAQLRSTYSLGAGLLEVDLRDVQLPPGDTSLHVRLGAGQIVVLVSDRVCVATHAHIGAGYVGALDRESGGLDVNWVHRPSAPTGVPRLLLSGRVGLGTLIVADRPLGHGGGFQPGAYGNNDACRTPPQLGAAQ